MKKFLLVLMTLVAFNTTFAAKKEKVDTTFTFLNFVPTSPDAVNEVSRTKALGLSRIEYPSFSGNNQIVTVMNKEMEKFIADFKETKNYVYKVTYSVTGNNAYFVSVLFNIERKNKTTNETLTYNDAISFNAKNGKPLLMKDIFVQNYDNALNAAVNDRIKQFGIATLDEKKRKFEGVDKKQKFYLEDDAIVFIFNQNEATDFGDKQLFIPFILTDLIGLLK
ncbi:hypothetical protein HMPREF1984_00960 [Leptotrichia sp. oral taxon 215 str. W9775]|jgi:hypothetical protein|uniref:DUF3298 domain-containing protein n=1 Tax=Leptotrichia sp. oral taxon 215 TaxID=712359 RepID=UPI0003AE766F|nr:DUF3298 domain-containing protein [Leptotrichia sp. oral taxon 215]ERK67705.1 hypothetical protein HMPREF1984_00960 [Leptotrichia sp. oral taxon 215 str. W9775]MBF1336393.1 DUF3298 domain-containing protein [Leptotrichia sp.]